MANRYAVQSGNWSDTATWDGGTLPGPGDVVRPNNNTVTIDQDIQVDELRNNASAPAAAGGIFVVSSIPGGGREATANIVTTGTVLNVTASSGTLTVNGDVIPASSANTNSVTINGTATIIWNGNVRSTSLGPNGSGINVIAAASVTVNGDVEAQSSPAIRLGSNASLVVNGTLSASLPAAGVESSAACVIDIQGEVIASNGAPAIRSTHASAVLRVKGPLRHAPNNRVPIVAEAMMVPASGNFEWIVKDDSAFPSDGADVHIARWHDNTPAPENVREGVTYSPDNSLSGTLAMPAPEAVAIGVPVGDTVGTAALTAETVWDHPTEAADTDGSMGKRLRNTATVASTGDQIVAALDNTSE